MLLSVQILLFDQLFNLIRHDTIDVELIRLVMPIKIVKLAIVMAHGQKLHGKLPFLKAC